MCKEIILILIGSTLSIISTKMSFKFNIKNQEKMVIAEKRIDGLIKLNEYFNLAMRFIGEESEEENMLSENIDNDETTLDRLKQKWLEIENYLFWLKKEQRLKVKKLHKSICNQMHDISFESIRDEVEDMIDSLLREIYS